MGSGAWARLFLSDWVGGAGRNRLDSGRWRGLAMVMVRSEGCGER